MPPAVILSMYCFPSAACRLSFFSGFVEALLCSQLRELVVPLNSVLLAESALFRTEEYW